MGIIEIRARHVEQEVAAIMAEYLFLTVSMRPEAESIL
jgi:hypothetical protein